MGRTHEPLRVLIVEDEDDMGWALSMLIGAEGHATAFARSAREALALLAKDSFHLAFVDLKLPDMDGLDLAARLRSLSPGLPCMLVTGYLYEDDEQTVKSLRAGLIAGFIGKPFELSQVRDALRRVAGTALSS
jgi:DNA-binding NtrC family response regulator